MIGKDFHTQNGIRKTTIVLLPQEGKRMKRVGYCLAILHQFGASSFKQSLTCSVEGILRDGERSWKGIDR